MATPTPAATKLVSTDALIGRTLGKYQVLRLVGEGGMGKVYEAVNTTIFKRVALKCIDRELAANEDTVARFQREALAASAVDSPYIVQIFDAGQDDGIPYIVMELLRGRDLGSLLAERGVLSPDDAVVVTRQVLKGLARAHQAGIVHRDLKPDNVFLVEHDEEPARVKLLDFGVSKITRAGSTPLKTLTQQGMVVGTPHYMSPEQAQAMPDVDQRTDIYSVGAMLYECLAGHPPHEGDSYEQVIVRICMHDAVDIRSLNPDVPTQLASVLHQALARQPAERFSDAREMLAALADVGPATSLPGIDLRGARVVTQPQAPAFADTIQELSADQLPALGDKHSGVQALALAHGADSGAVGTQPGSAAIAARARDEAEPMPASEAVPLPPRHSLLPWAAAAALLAAVVGAGIYLAGDGGIQTGASASATSRSRGDSAPTASAHVPRIEPEPAHVNPATPPSVRTSVVAEHQPPPRAATPSTRGVLATAPVRSASPITGPAQPVAPQPRPSPAPQPVPPAPQGLPLLTR